MECKILIENEGINEIKSMAFSPELLSNSKIHWIHFKVENRAQLSQIDGGDVFSESLITRLQNPGKSFLVERIGDARVLDCNINYNFNEINNDFLSFVFLEKVVVTLTTHQSPVSEDVNPEGILDLKRPYSANLVILTIFRAILDRNTEIVSQFTKKVDKILKHSIAKAFDTPESELEQLHTISVDINELFEDQLTTIRLLPLRIEEGNDLVLGFLDRVEKSMEYLVNITDRAQEKLDYILQRYANVLQQKANARLNTLTIVQAIFVPLTFLAGIYGMNFVNIPELEMPNGYFYLLGLMLLMGLGSLYLFYRNGWFKSK